MAHVPHGALRVGRRAAGQLPRRPAAREPLARLGQRSAVLRLERDDQEMLDANGAQAEREVGDPRAPALVGPADAPPPRLAIRLVRHPIGGREGRLVVRWRNVQVDRDDLEEHVEHCIARADGRLRALGGRRRGRRRGRGDLLGQFDANVGLRGPTALAEGVVQVIVWVRAGTAADSEAARFARAGAERTVFDAALADVPLRARRQHELSVLVALLLLTVAP
eukprot:4803552-Prymnesium_polylepis.1